MKKTLFATTALVAFGFAGAAMAAEPLTASVSGYMHVGVGYNNVDQPADPRGDISDIGIMRDGEVHFGFKGSSDNGLTFDGRIELEGFTSGDQIDENWARVSGSWGWVMIGGNDAASYNMATGVFYAPGGKIGHYDAFGESNPPGTYLTNARTAGDPISIFYNTPNWSGFQAQISYTPSDASDGGADGVTSLAGTSRGGTVGAAKDWISIGLNYGADFDGGSFRLSGGYDYVDTNGKGAGTGNDDGWSLGGQVFFGGFGIGGFWQTGLEAVNGGSKNEYVVNISYATGPWGFGAGYARGDSRFGTGVDTDMYAGWVSYALAPGVKTSFGVESSNGSKGTGNGVAALAWMTLSF